MAQPQKPETFMLSNEAQQSLPQDAQVALSQVDNLKYFLISAPVDWSPESLIRRFLLPTGEYVSCVLWSNLFHISGTDIVRCLSFRFQAFGRPVKNPKKFEEGIFSDLRNLKSGTDASLEEPKSPFLDFLYKNNCIRTQKKQKVFYWYSVPHDRLFLDALERDLKREKMGQEATTKAVSEPALSFEFDSSQSLFEQLTKAQQASSSSFATANAGAAAAYSQSTSPVMRAADSMPPPQMLPQQMPRSIEQHAPPMYAAHSMAAPMSQQMPTMMPREPDYSQMGSYDRTHMRHASMPAYMEYSPAPSFVSSHFEDYSNRGMSYEPITPPQHGGPVGEPAYIANEDTGLYSAIPEMQPMPSYNPMAHMPPTTMAGPTAYANSPRAFAPSNVYSVIEGSPTYKARRRRSSIPSSIMNAVAANAVAQVTQLKQHVPNRPSDLRRSMSSSVLPIAEGDESQGHSPPGLTHSYPSSVIHRDQNDYSRHTTPLASLEEEHHHGPMGNGNESFPSFNDDLHHHFPGSAAVRMERPGPVRRARSATMMELGMPYKSHSCPIPSCGRLFKRLEHLKRYVIVYP